MKDTLYTAAAVLLLLGWVLATWFERRWKKAEWAQIALERAELEVATALLREWEQWYLTPPQQGGAHQRLGIASETAAFLRAAELVTASSDIPGWRSAP